MREHTRDVAWRVLIFAIIFHIPRLRRIQYPAPCKILSIVSARPETFAPVFQLELRRDFYPSLINVPILNNIHEELLIALGNPFDAIASYRR